MKRLLLAALLLCLSGAEPLEYDVEIRATVKITPRVAPTPVPDDPVPVPTPDGLAQPADVKYLGAILVPQVPWTPDRGNKHFGYGGYAPCIHDGGMYLAGRGPWLAKISLPEPKIAPVEELNRAELLLPFADVTDGKLTEHNATHLGGSIVHGERLFWTMYHHYGGDPPALGSAALNLTDAAGPWKLGNGTTNQGFMAGYLATVPAEYQALGPLVCGQSALSIATRTSTGPAGFAFDPENPAAAKPLVYYPTTDEQNWRDRMGIDPDSGFDDWIYTFAHRGSVFLPNGFLAVGWEHVGEIWKGNNLLDEQGRVVNPATGAVNPCGGAGSSGAQSSEGRESVVYFFDPADVLAVARGEKQPWEPVPYAKRVLTELGRGCLSKTKGATFDRATGRLYVVQESGEDWLRDCRDNCPRMPLVHIYEVQ